MKVRLAKITQWDVAPEDWHMVQSSIENAAPGMDQFRWDYSGIDDLEFVGVDFSCAKYSPRQWVALARKQGAELAPNVFENIAEKLRLDHSIRKNGKRMAAKFGGKDAVTGKKYEAGTEIIWSGVSHAAVIA